MEFVVSFFTFSSALPFPSIIILCHHRQNIRTEGENCVQIAVTGPIMRRENDATTENSQDTLSLPALC